MMKKFFLILTNLLILFLIFSWRNNILAACTALYGPCGEGFPACCDFPTNVCYDARCQPQSSITGWTLCGGYYQPCCPLPNPPCATGLNCEGYCRSVPTPINTPIPTETSLLIQCKKRPPALHVVCDPIDWIPCKEGEMCCSTPEGCNPYGGVADSAAASGIPTQISSPTPAVTTGATDNLGYEPCEEGKGVQTALGCIPFEADALVRFFFRNLMGVVGGIGLLLMIYGSFLVLTSQGDQEKVKRGREIITTTVSGILFIIFSLFLLRFIGIEILHIPGLE